MPFGDSVFKKFNKDGTIRQYSGHSVVCMIEDWSNAFEPILEMTNQLKELEVAEKFIMLPSYSYHMTVIQGGNDQVRKPEYWSKFKDVHTPMEEMNAFFEERFKHIEPLGNLCMKFDRVQINTNDFRILLKPIDAQVERELRSYRNKVAEKFGVMLPGHQDYQFHVTLAYVWKLFNDREMRVLNEFAAKVNLQLKEAHMFRLSKERLVYYQDMFSFKAN